MQCSRDKVGHDLYANRNLRVVISSTTSTDSPTIDVSMLLWPLHLQGAFYTSVMKKPRINHMIIITIM